MLTSIFFRYLLSAFFVFLLASRALVTATERGFVEGQMKIIFGMAVGPSDEMPRPEIKPQSYAEYPLIVLSQEDKKEIARVTADQSGNYRIALAPGNYVLDVQDRVAKHIRGAPRPFTVVSNQTVHVDMSIIIGFRSAGGCSLDREKIYMWDNRWTKRAAERCAAKPMQGETFDEPCAVRAKAQAAEGATRDERSEPESAERCENSCNFSSYA